MKKLITVTLNEEADGELTLETDADGWDANLLATLIHALGRVRANTEPSVPKEFMEDPHVDITGHPRWIVASHFAHEAVLGLRHPMYGWLAFQIGKDFPKQLEKGLQSLTTLPDQEKAH